MGHSTPSHQAVATTPSDFTRMLLWWLLLMKNEGLPSRFAIKWSLAPRKQGRISRKNSILRLFVRFSIISPKFCNQFCSFRLHCVQDIPTNNSVFLKIQLSCVLTSLRRKTPKNGIFDITCELYLRFSRSRSENVSKGPWINAQYSWFCPFLGSPN